MLQELEKVDIHPSRLKGLARKVKWLFSIYFPKEYDAKILTKNDYLFFNSKDKTTGRILSVYKNHEYIEMQNVVDFLRNQKILNGKDDIVIDIGGYIGMSSTGFLLSDFFQKAYSFEPSPENFRLLKKNIDVNNLQDEMQAFNIALSDAKGSLEFELGTKNYGDNRVRKVENKGTYGEDKREVIEIESNSFDSFLEEHSEIEQEKIKLLWMDIQGHEGQFLKGAKNFILSHINVPTAMEFWPYGMERSA